MAMFIKLPASYIEPNTQLAMPDAVLIISDTEFRLRAGDVRVTVRVYASADVIDLAAPVSEYLLPALSQEEIGEQLPALLQALYEVILARPEYADSELIGGTPYDGVYTSAWNWHSVVGQPFAHGEMRSNTTDWPGASLLTFSVYSNNSAASKQAVLLDLLKQGNRLLVHQVNAAAIRALYEITADAVFSSRNEWITVPVTLVESSGTTPADGLSVYASAIT
jgi:hypothetical protein